MGMANRITLFRIALAPVFAGLFFLWTAWPNSWFFAALWLVFLVSESSDVLDGWVARRLKETSDLGKLLDPFSDVISRLTIFLCLTIVGIAPVWFFLLVLYRELSMTFLRMIMIQHGVVVAASKGGKIKAWLYFFASIAGLAALGWPQLAPHPFVFWTLKVLFAVAAVQSVVSFSQYFRRYLALRKKSS